MEGKPGKGVVVLLAILALGLMALSGVLLLQMHALNTRLQTLRDTIRDTTSSFDQKFSNALDSVQKGMAAATSERASLMHDVQSLRSVTEKQAVAMNQAITDNLGKMDEHFREQIAAQEKSLASALGQISEHVDQQTAVMNRALGNVIAVVMPPEWVKQLAGLEERLKKSTDWPKNAKEAQEFLDQTSDLISTKKLPAWAEADYRPRLTPVRWAALAFVALNRDQKVTPLPDIVEEMDNLAGAKPDGGSVELQGQLIKESKRLSNKLDQAKMEEARRLALDYVGSVDRPSADTALDIESVADMLRLREKDYPLADKICELRKQLHDSMVTRQAERQSASLKERWAAVKAHKEDQPRIYELAANMLLQEVATAKVAVALEGIKKPIFDGLETEIRGVITDIATQVAKREEERQAKAMRKYQQWALNEVVAFEHSFKQTEDKAKKASKVYGETWSDALYQEVRDAMVEHLLPVNEALLDPAVQHRLERAYNNGWSKLDGRDDETFVEKRAELTVKKALFDFVEKQP